MKLSNIIAFAGLACAAAPKAPIVERNVALVEARQTTVFDSLLDSITEIGSGIQDSLDAVSATSNAVINAGLFASIQLRNALRDAVVDLTAEIDSATDELTTIATDLTDDLANNVITLTQAQITVLENAIAAAQDIIANINVVVEGDLAEVPLLFLIAIRSQIAALEAVLGPFVAPLTALIDGAIDAANSVNLIVTGLDNAADELTGQLDALLDFIGLDGLLGLLFPSS